MAAKGEGTGVDQVQMVTGAAERSVVSRGGSHGAGVMLPDDDLVEVDAPSTPPRRTPWLRRGLGVLAVVGVVIGAGTVPWLVRQEVATTRREATAARTEAATASARRDRAEAEVDARLVELDASYASAAEATAAREAQRARLVELQLAEETLGDVVAQARRDTEAVEAERRNLDDAVQQQAVDLPQLEGCLAQVRRLVDTAFLATVNPGIVVPSISPACRALLTAVEGRGA